MDALSPLRLPVVPGLGMGLPENPARLRPIAPAEIQSLVPDSGTRPVGETGSGGSFENVLGKLVNEVNDSQVAEHDTVRGLLGGENIPLHRVMLATEEANLSFQLMVEVRNKLLEGYQELMRMQV